jgi:hypothetical protein
MIQACLDAVVNCRHSRNWDRRARPVCLPSSLLAIPARRGMTITELRFSLAMFPLMAQTSRNKDRRL